MRQIQLIREIGPALWLCALIEKWTGLLVLLPSENGNRQ